MYYIHLHYIPSMTLITLIHLNTIYPQSLNQYKLLTKKKKQNIYNVIQTHEKIMANLLHNFILDYVT